MRWLSCLSAIALLAACTPKEARQIDRAFVISFEQAGIGGTYLTPSPNGDVVSDVDGNLIEDVMGCGFIDIRVVDEPGRLHGSGFAIWVAERSITNMQRQCLKRELPKDATLAGPVPVSELTQRVGL